jgi:hypothetical protein
MALFETVVTILGLSLEAVGLSKEATDFIRNKTSLEKLLGELVESSFKTQAPRLNHLCKDGKAEFYKDGFIELIKKQRIDAVKPGELTSQLIKPLQRSISTPGSTCDEKEFTEIYNSLLEHALNDFFRKISRFDGLANEVMLKQNFETIEKIDHLGNDIEKIAQLLNDLSGNAKIIWTRIFDKLNDYAPPKEQQVGEKVFQNPFNLSRAEDFNHNYNKIARLFQDTPEWENIRSRTENIFIEGGRGTGKSMLLRRLTAQTSIAAAKLETKISNYEDLGIDYYGVYVKLTRGYYDQFEPDDNMNKDISSLMAQHELNLEILDAFVDSLQWMIKEQVLPQINNNQLTIIKELNRLFPNAPDVNSFNDLRNVVFRFEQNQILKYCRDIMFNNVVKYEGSAIESGNFIRSLSQIFRNNIFPDHEIRLFLLLDEFESLTSIQQASVNTVIKMRLPDISIKVAVRKGGRKTMDTFTPGDPIQIPRDYTEIFLDYDIKSKHYQDLLLGISEKRLEAAGYKDKDLRHYLFINEKTVEASNEEIEQELNSIWQSGKRLNPELNEEFRKKYRTAAIYRILIGRRKLYAGFPQFVILSSGIVSNFIELCKYSFFLALKNKQDLEEIQKIPEDVQTEAVYMVSQRLLYMIEANVPKVGSILYRLVNDLGSILRTRLLNHPSEPEANRLSIRDFDKLNDEKYILVSQVIENAVIWSVFHFESIDKAFRPKNQFKPQTAELIINRIYCPALEISPRSRWRVSLSIDELDGLLSDKLRDTTFKALVKKLAFEIQTDQSQKNLFEEE